MSLRKCVHGSEYPSMTRMLDAIQSPADLKKLSIDQLAQLAGEMREVARRFPQDSDVQTMYAESLMNINAWKLCGLALIISGVAVLGRSSKS